jgi:hypothetical protein
VAAIKNAWELSKTQIYVLYKIIKVLITPASAVYTL